MNKIKLLIGPSANTEVTCFTNTDSSREKRKLDRVVEGIGGTSLNFALQTEMFGVEVHLMATVGKDFRAKLLEMQIRERLKGQLTSIPCRVGTSFAHVVIQTNDNKRTMDSFKGEYLEMPYEEIRNIVQSESWNAVVMTGIMPEEAELVQMAFAHSSAAFKSNCLRILNPRVELTLQKIWFEKLLAVTDVVCMNEKEYAGYIGSEIVTQEGLDLLHSFGPEVVIVTKGAEGVTVSTGKGKDNRTDLPACIVGAEKDATGAGDAFLASFTTRFCAGESAVDAAKFGSFVAGIAVTKVGGSNTVTTAELAELAAHTEMGEKR